jgi:hypothetical protein
LTISATTIIPQNEYAERAAKHSRKATGITTQASYDEAAAVCTAKVAKIVKECRRVNQKYRDPHFDLEFDLKWGKRDTLESLRNVKDPTPSDFRPKSVKRVVDIFDNPKFYIDGPTANDVRQGRDGDCWLLAALCTLSNKPSLIERCCVARDEQVGVYGFVFHRDGEWISEIIDDKLFLTKPDFEESFLERILWEDRERVNSEEQYRKAYQSGSGALYFAQCEHADETWLPLLEKAYAKAHGDYSAIEGGFTGEGIEDLTGGVTSELYTSDILDKEYFWNEELMKVNDEFLFGCSTGMWGIGWGDRKGIVELHAYSIMRAVEMDGQRLVLLKNPWGKGEWKGPWSDGSKEWTAEWLLKLDHRFGDDGAFWISYQDLLRKYQAFDRTRLFGPDWKVVSLWTTLSVPWTLDYHDTQFALSLSQTGPVVLVLSQLDDRYYRGLEGQYRFELNFRLHKAGQEDYVVRSISPYCQNRSVNVELELEAGEYTVLLKVNATRNMDILPIEEVVRNHARERRDKLVAVGMSYDLAHSKGMIIETEEEKKARKEDEKRKKDKEKRELKKKLMDSRKKNHYLDVKDQKKRREKKAKAKAKAQLKREQKAEKAKAKKAKNETAKSKPSKENKQEEVDRDKPKTSQNEKHVQILSPSPTPDPDDAKKDVVSKDSSDSSADGSVKTPSTGSEKSFSPDATADDAQMGKSPNTPSNFDVKTETSNDTKANDEVQEPPEVIQPDVLPSPEIAAVYGEAKDSANDRSPVHKAADANCLPDGLDPKTEPEPDEPDDMESGDATSSSDESDISSVSDLSDRELEIEMERRVSPRGLAPPPLPAMNVPEVEDEFERNPWNAVATVGLRVYYKVSDEDKDKEIVKLRVVRPHPTLKKREDSDDDDEKGGEDDDEIAKGEGAGAIQTDDGDSSGEIEKGLDVDDSSKDATLVGDQERRKKSIVPSGDSGA